MEWDWQQSFRKGLLDQPKTFDLPLWDGTGEDPLEAALDLPWPEPRIFLGDTVFFRAFHGRYLDVEGARARARYSDKGEWQQFILCPVGEPQRGRRVPLKDGDDVSILAHTGSFVGVEDGRVSAMWPVADEPCVFKIKLAMGAGELRHRSPVFLQSRLTGLVLGANGHDEQGGEVKEWGDLGSWQRFVLEKLRPGGAKATARKPLPRRRSIMDLSGPCLKAPSTPVRRRSSSQYGSAAKVPAAPRRSSVSSMALVEPETGRCPRTSRGGTKLLAASRATPRKNASEAITPLDLSSRFQAKTPARQAGKKAPKNMPKQSKSRRAAKVLPLGKGSAKARIVKRTTKPTSKTSKAAGLTGVQRKPKSKVAFVRRASVAALKSKSAKGGAKS